MIKLDTGCCNMTFNSNISNEEGVNAFIDFYMKKTNEKIKPT